MKDSVKTFEIKDFSFTYAGAGTPSLSDINFSVNYGEFITICGKTGSGKSTLLRNLKTVLAPYGEKKGEISFYGRVLNQVSSEEQSKRIGFVLQDPENQIVTDKVWHELAFGLENLGIDTDSIRTRVAEMATFFGISGWIGKNTAELSGGQKQLLNLAAIMAMNPDVLILDEPTSALDPIATEEFIDNLIKINKNIGTTVIISEHDLDHVLPASDRVIIMDRGSILTENIPEKIGNSVSAEDSDFLLSMPVPFQIYMGSQKKIGIDPTQNTGKIPLTVRDGRNWLTKAFEGCDLRRNRFDDENNITAATRPENEIKLKDIRYKYGRDSDDVIKNLDMEISKGEITAIVGGNGAGKSTLLRIIAGIYKPYLGKVKTASEKIILLPQNPQTMFTGETVEKELLEIIRLIDIESNDKSDDIKNENSKIDEMLKLMKLEDLRERHAYDLSGGEQQRVAFAKVLLAKGDVYLLDEPTTGQDGVSKKMLGGIIRKLSNEGKTIVIVSHDLEFAAQYADRCLLLFDGQIMSSGTPRHFFSNNTYYTTAGNRMSRHIFENAVTVADVIEIYRENAGD